MRFFRVPQILPHPHAGGKGIYGADSEKQERQRAEHQTTVADGKMAFADFPAIYEQRPGGLLKFAVNFNC
jgi:hypothetical protein